MCDIWQRTDAHELSATSLIRHRDSLIHLGVRQVVLSGGEPLLNRDLPAILDFLGALDIRVTLLTTGLLLHKHAGLLVEGVDDIIVSLDGPAPIHDSIRRIPRAFETITRGIETIRSLRPTMPIACRTTVQKQNHSHLRATVDAAHSLGLDSISFLPVDVSSIAFNRELPWAFGRQEEVALSLPELAALELEIEELIANYNRDISTRFIRENETKLRHIAGRFREHLIGTPPRSPKCNAPWVSTVMEVDGTLRPCFFHPPVASTAELTLEQALNTPSARAFRTNLDVASDPTCQHCVCSLNYQTEANSAVSKSAAV
jgi:MoaA/NifB/PqqE/SkfB family radical SAM enzyme